jgi:hypothetical protein
MNLEQADKISKILDNQGWSVKVYTKKDDKHFTVSVFAAEGLDREIRNSVPMFYWFFYWLHATTIHEPNDKIIVEFE